MKLLTKGAILAGACSLLFGASIALSSVTPAAAVQVHPEKKKGAKYTPDCSSSSPCTLGDNSSYGPGVEGYSTDGVGVISYNDTESYYTLFAYSYNDDGYPFAALNAEGYGMFLEPDGVLYAYGFEEELKTHHGLMGTFASTSTRPVLEDVGTGRLQGGEGTVRFDSNLSGAIQANRGYQVFLTPDGESRGLYVAQKFVGGFIVREAEHGRSNLYFDYRIVAHPIGAPEARLPQVRNMATGPDGRVSR
jgi:hypothetical protein